MTYRPSRALDLLRRGTGIADANFRPGQEEAIRHVVDGRGRLLVVEKTGWGKSFVYFIATRLLRESGRGPALLVSPLLSLMRNQILAAERMGVRAARITSDNTEAWPEVEAGLGRDEVDILLIAPERFANDRFRDQVLAGIADRISLFVIDECHCISDWGHDFRPDYQLIERAARALPPNMRLLATTATASNRVMDDLRDVLGHDLRVQRGPLARPSLTLQTICLPQQSQRLAWLAEQVPRIPGHGIIYTLTVRDAEQVADWLRSRGVNAGASLVSRWGPNPQPAWVTCIPSRRNPSLVPDFAERLARKLGLPFHPVLVKTEDRRQQKEMENTVQQARNVDGSLAVAAPHVPPTPVLLVDDIVGSRWTLTVAAWLLRKNGSGTVWPFALSTLGRS